MSMIESEMDWPLADRIERLTDMEQTLAAIIAITRSDWLPRERASPSPDETGVDRARCEHLLFRLAWNSMVVIPEPRAAPRALAKDTAC
jgi:hypothetical protein